VDKFMPVQHCPRKQWPEWRRQRSAGKELDHPITMIDRERLRTAPEIHAIGLGRRVADKEVVHRRHGKVGHDFDQSIHLIFSRTMPTSRKATPACMANTKAAPIKRKITSVSVSLE
jgi:hypothetical protein